MQTMDTPIFESVQTDQHVTMPLPPAGTHDDFLCRNEFPEFLMHAEAILRGEVQPPPKKKRSTTPRPRKSPVPKGLVPQGDGFGGAVDRGY